VLAPVSRERTGYPTQKPEALLERLILALSDEGEVVLDPYAGSGTTLAVAHRLGRSFIGIDASPVALDVVRARMAAALPEGAMVEAAPSALRAPHTSEHPPLGASGRRRFNRVSGGSGQ